MRKFISVILLVSAWLPGAVAQVVVEVTLEQEQFLPGEALPVAVRVSNRSGQTLHLGTQPDWLTFSVESRDGFIVRKNGETPVLGEFTLESSQVATKRADVEPYFTLTRPGRYHINATTRIKEWEGQVTSPPKIFDIIEGTKVWTQEFGVPATAKTNEPPEVRRYTLLHANYLRSQLRLYFRLTDVAESKVFKVIPLGNVVSFGRPEACFIFRSQESDANRQPWISAAESKSWSTASSGQPGMKSKMSRKPPSVTSIISRVARRYAHVTGYVRSIPVAGSISLLIH